MRVSSALPVFTGSADSGKVPAGVYRYETGSQRQQVYDLVADLERQGVPFRQSGHTANESPDKPSGWTNDYGFVAVGKRNVERYEQLADISYKSHILNWSLTQFTDPSATHPFNVMKRMQDTTYRLPRDVRGAYRSFQSTWERMLKQLETLNRVSNEAIRQYILQGQPLPRS